MSDKRESFVTPNYSMKIVNKGQGIMIPDSVVTKLVILEGINKIPQIQLYIKTAFASQMVLLDDLDITIENEDVYKLEFTFGIYRAKPFGENILYEGYMCERAFFMEPGSEYLGDTLSDAIDTLALRDKADGVDSVEGGYWRLNETRMEAFRRLMRGAKENSVWVVNTEEVKVLDLSQEPANAEDFWPPSNIEYIAYTNRFTSEDIYNLYYDEDHEENVMYNAVWNSMSYIGFDHKDFTQNVISSMKYAYPMEQLFKLHYNRQILTYDVGSVMKMEMDEFTSENMYLVSKVTSFNIENVETVAYFSIGKEYEPPKGGSM